MSKFPNIDKYQPILKIFSSAFVATSKTNHDIVITSNMN